MPVAATQPVLRQQFGPRHVVSPVLALSGWGVLFTVGLFVGSAPYRDALGRASQLSVSTLLYDIFVAFITYTYTNAAILSGLAAVLGAYALELTLITRRSPEGVDRGERTAHQFVPSRLNLYVGAVVRSFFVYLAAVSGVIVFVKDPIEAPTQPGYVGFACYTSLLSFVISYRPEWFNVLVKLVMGLVGSAATPGEEELKPEKEPPSPVRRVRPH